MEKASAAPSSKKIVIFLPISVPGSGKSFLMNQFLSLLKEKYDSDLHVISSDVLRKKLMDELLAKNPSLSSEELFSMTGKRAPHYFNEELAKLLKTISKLDKTINFLFLDKNLLPNALPRTIEGLQDRCESLFDSWRFVGLYPDSFKPHRLSKKNITYPFSMNFMMNCLQRVQNRKGNHETLNGQGYKSANVLFSFINGYRNEELNDEVLRKAFRLHLAVKMPMTLETKETNELFDTEFIEMFNDIIKDDNPRFDSEKNSDKIQKFLEIFEARKFTFQQVSMEDISKFLQNLVETCLALFKSTKEDNSFVSNKQASNEESKETHPVYQKKSQGYPNKQPIYLGVFPNDERGIREIVSKHIEKNLQWYSEGHPEDKNLAFELKNLKNTFRFPNSLHVTSLFIGGNKAKLSTPYYQTFTEGVPLVIEIEAIVYVPNRLICAIVFFDPAQLKIENEHPHMTLMISGYDAKHSNNVMSALFKYHTSPLKGSYSQDFFRKHDSIEFCFHEVRIDTERASEKHRVYVLRKDEILRLEATTALAYK